MDTKHENKVRDMRGVTIGRGSAGRANGGRAGVRMRAVEIGLLEMDAACTAFLRSRGLKCSGMSWRW